MIQCDFDDTITDGNVSQIIREAFAPPGWNAMEDEYLEGKLSVEESNIAQFALITADRREIEEYVLGAVVVRFAFDEFVDYCRGEGIRLVVVSSGLDLYIRPVMVQLGLNDLEVHSGKAETSPDGMKVEYTDPSGLELTRGFKESYVRHFKGQGHSVIYLGDGLSDQVPAQEADFVIARSRLEQHMSSNGLPHYSFDTFSDVGKHVEEIRRSARG